MTETVKTAKKQEIIPQVPEFLRILQAKGQEAGLSFTEEQLQKFGKYYEMLIITNNQMNLTTLTSPEDVAVKHMIDSLLCYNKDTYTGKNLIDVGTGAGFPGIPLKIYCPSIKVTLLDSLAKRLDFLQNVIKELNLQDITCVHARAEDGGHDKKLRGKFDIVTARAVARLSVLAEYTLPFAKTNGMVVALKGSAYAEEIKDATSALKILGGKIISAEQVKLPGLDDGRAIIVIKKLKETSGRFPRKAGLPAKQPLV